jgi:hypothetical protein
MWHQHSVQMHRCRVIALEASHPNLAAVMNRLIDLLGQMGI